MEAQAAESAVASLWRDIFPLCGRAVARRAEQMGTGVPPVSDETEKTGGTPVPLFQPLDQEVARPRKRRLQALPLHFASLSKTGGKAKLRPTVE